MHKTSKHFDVFSNDLCLNGVDSDKVWMYKEIMMSDDNLESNLPTSSLLRMCCLVQVELYVYCPVAGDELTVSVFRDLTLQINLFSGKRMTVVV